MAKKFRVGDRVKWNNEGGGSKGKVIGVKTKSFYRTGKDGTKYKQHASKENPKYKLESETGYISWHFGKALTKLTS